MPIEHTIEFYERVELLRLEKKGENFVPKLFKKVIDSCLKNCYPNLKQNQIKKYNDKIFFVLVDKKPAKDTHLLNPYGFFTIKVESENDINKVVIYDLCKSFQGEDNDIICRIMLRKFIEHLEKVSFQLNIKEANQENNLLIHEIVIYVSKNKNDEVKISCYNEVGFKSEDETIVMKNNNEEEEFEKYKLPLPPSKFLEKNTNTNQEKTANTIKESANSSNISNSVNKEPEVLTPEAISNGNNLGTITGQLEEIIKNEKVNMEKQVEEEKMNTSSDVNKSKEETDTTNEGQVTPLSNGFSSVETNTEKEEKAKLEQSTKEQEEIDEKEKNSSFFGNIASTVTGFMTGSSSTTNSEEKEQPNSDENSTSSTVSNTVTNTTNAISTAASNTAQAVGNVASNTMQSAQNLFTSKNNTSNETNNSNQTLQNSNNNNSNNIQSTQTNSFSQPNESSQNNSNENKGNNISISISENNNSEEEEQQQPQQQGGKKKNTKKKSKLTKKKKSKKNTKKKKTKINKKIMKGG